MQGNGELAPPLGPQEAMRDLNGRLAGFLSRVQRLQETNEQLEGQIREWLWRRAPRERDWSQQERILDELKGTIRSLLVDNASLALQTDSAHSEAARLRARCAAEESRTRHLENRVAWLKGVWQEAELQKAGLEEEVQGRLADLDHLHHSHQQAALALQQSARPVCDAVLLGAEREDGSGMELSQLLDEIRTHYDRLIALSGAGRGAAADMPRGPLTQLEEEAARERMTEEEEAMKAARAELTEARRQWQSLQVEIESLHALEKGLANSLQETELQYRSELRDLAAVIRRLEAELSHVRQGLDSQRQRHEELLNTKVRLEREIATYRHLLDKEENRLHGPNPPRKEARPVLAGSPRKAVAEAGREIDTSPAWTAGGAPAPQHGAKKTPQLQRQGSLVTLSAPETQHSPEKRMETVTTQEILQGNVMRESAEARGTVETEKIDEVIKEWEGSFFKGNPRLRKKSVSLRFDLHLAAADEGCAQTRQDSLPDVEVRLIMKRSRSIPTIAQ
ncbi:keratin-like protein KRT222 isoform X2 [Lepisosteus oculatus]